MNSGLTNGTAVTTSRPIIHVNPENSQHFLATKNIRPFGYFQRPILGYSNSGFPALPHTSLRTFIHFATLMYE